MNTAQAGETGWLSFAARCRAEFLPSWAETAKQGQSWESDSNDNLFKLGEMTQKICPNYLQHPNDSDAIAAFSLSKSEILDHSPSVEKQEQALLSFLRANFDLYRATFASVDIDFALTPCGQHMLSTEALMSSRMDEIHSRAQSLARSCFQLSGPGTPAGARKTSAATNGRGSPGPAASGGTSSSPSSDITGLPSPAPGNAPPK